MKICFPRIRVDVTLERLRIERLVDVVKQISRCAACQNSCSLSKQAMSGSGRDRRKNRTAAYRGHRDRASYCATPCGVLFHESSQLVNWMERDHGGFTPS
jgi:hypothetical protein